MEHQPTPTAAPRATVAPSPTTDCPPDWQFFDNTVLHYTICYPPDWGIQSQHSAVAVATLTEQEMTQQVTIAGPGWFPMEPGSTTLDALPSDVRTRAEQAPRVLLNFVGEDTQFQGCTPNNARTIAGIEARWCIETFSITAHERAEYTPDGEWRQLKVLVPLRSSSGASGFNGLQEKDGQLVISAVSLRHLYDDRKVLLWSIIDSIKAVQ